MTSLSDSPTTPSVRLRAATAMAHQQAESSPFIDDLISGRLDVDAYRALTAQLYFVYRSLEQVGDELAGDPIADAVLDKVLNRTPRLVADLAALGTDPASATPLPAVQRYVAAIEDTRTDAVRYLAHHYTRYLGDLSGGQVVAHRLREHYGLGDEQLSFYAFDINKLKRYKDDYRARVDGLDLSAGALDRLVDESVAAFGYNQALFADLAADRA